MNVDIRGNSDVVSIEVIDYENPAAQNVDDANWLMCCVRVKASVFSGEYQSSFRTEEFAAFHKELASATENLDGVASFETAEDALRMTVQLKMTGEAIIKGVAKSIDVPHTYLSFCIVSDQSYLTQTCRQLQALLHAFPVKM